MFYPIYLITYLCFYSGNSNIGALFSFGGASIMTVRGSEKVRFAVECDA
jgi:hypothetical protein